MNTVTPEKKDKMTKTLAVLGFLTVIALIVIATIGIIKYLPTGFSSLASLSESLDKYRTTGEEEDPMVIVLTSTTTEGMVGEPVTISWKKIDGTGSYSFAYDCTDGVALDIVDTEGLRTITCETNYDLGDTDTVTIIASATSTEDEFIDYTVAFTPENEPESTHFADESLTVLPKKDGMVASEMDSEPTPAPTPTTSPAPYLGAPDPTPVRTTPTPKPVSTPRGYVDLATAYVGVGTIDGNRFKAGRLEQNTDGAVQFTITNIGTKTSGYFRYSVTLPDGGSYASPKQAPLAPGEIATISLGFPVDEVRSHTFVILAVDSTDTLLGNNSVRKEVEIKK